MAREKRLNDECRAEVEAMLRGQVAPAQSTMSSPVNLRCSASETATSVNTQLSVAEMLTKLQLPQYIEAFESQCVDLPTLAMVQQRQGTAALDEALKELGVMITGHRIKIRAFLA